MPSFAITPEVVGLAYIHPVVGPCGLREHAGRCHLLHLPAAAGVASLEP